MHFMTETKTSNDQILRCLLNKIWLETARMLCVQKGETEGYHRELEELRRKNDNLVKEVERLTMQAEKPLEHQVVSSCHVLNVKVNVALSHCQTTSHKNIEVRQHNQNRN